MELFQLEKIQSSQRGYNLGGFASKNSDECGFDI